MDIADRARFDMPQGQLRKRDAIFLLSCAMVAVVLLIGIYLGSVPAATGPGDAAWMSVFL
jgi:hypothetical protein